jgi:hypothetical protein
MRSYFAIPYKIDSLLGLEHKPLQVPIRHSQLGSLRGHSPRSSSQCMLVMFGASTSTVRRRFLR